MRKIHYFGREITRKETTHGAWEYVRYYRYLKDMRGYFMNNITSILQLRDDMDRII
jgi:hypothetical protein